MSAERSASAFPGNTHPRSWIGLLLRSVHYLLMSSGLIMFSFFAAAQVHAVLGRAQAIAAFEHAAARPARADELSTDGALTGEATGLPGIGEAPDQSLWAPGRVEAFRESLSGSIRAPIGILRIPSIELTVPIFDGTSSLSLNRGVGRIEGTARVDERGNLGIAGHRDGFFRGLKDLEVGDVISVQLPGANKQYRISEFLVVDPEDIYVLRPTTDDSVTLITCYPFYFVGNAPRRFVVRAELSGAEGDS